MTEHEQLLAENELLKTARKELWQLIEWFVEYTDEFQSSTMFNLHRAARKMDAWERVHGEDS